MSEVIVVSDTSAISNLVQINQLVLLTKLFAQIVVPPTVFVEVMQLRNFGITVQSFAEAQASGHIRIQDIIDPLDNLTELRSFLDKGESEAIILAKELIANR